jgi:hypothetical protein
VGRNLADAPVVIKIPPVVIKFWPGLDLHEDYPGKPNFVPAGGILVSPALQYSGAPAVNSTGESLF